MSRVRQISKYGRWWQKTPRGGWTLQCLTCAKFRAIKHFRLLAPGQWEPQCPACAARPAVTPATASASEVPLLRAAKQVFPDFVEYAGIPGVEVLADPERYPGRTYWHLTPEQRDLIVARAKALVFEETGVDFRFAPLTEFKQDQRERD